MTRPSAETNEPDPPLLKRTDDFCKCSYHSGGASNWYLSLRSFLGGLLKSQSPSSAGSGLVCVMMIASTSPKGRIRDFIGRPHGEKGSRSKPADAVASTHRS